MLERDLGSSVNSGQGLRFSPWTRNGSAGCRVCHSFEMLLMWWDTCHDPDEGQNLTSTYAPALSIDEVEGEESEERNWLEL